MTHAAESGINVSHLRELAEKATPGPWTALQNNGEVAGVTRLFNPETQHDICHCESPGRNEAGHNAAFIAACDPTMIVALLDEIEELKVRDIVSRNPGIDPDEVRAFRKERAS